MRSLGGPKSNVICVPSSEDVETQEENGARSQSYAVTCQKNSGGYQLKNKAGFSLKAFRGTGAWQRLLISSLQNYGRINLRGFKSLGSWYLVTSALPPNTNTKILHNRILFKFLP